MEERGESESYREKRKKLVKVVTPVTAAASSAIARPVITRVDGMTATADLLDIADLIRCLGIEALRGAGRHDLRAVEIALRDAADMIARELRIELVLLDDWHDK
ncbi:hypothetical protein ACKWRH_21890 [Bradyrhizobium sp. Pa8]|uniref:hypothetical protein n=1 Tax=Bradyrhizobium sp. Pa8 TaxID=3386552 RepID=UPI00403F121C